MCGPIDQNKITKKIEPHSGLMQRAAEYICKMAVEKKFTVTAGYVEIYNEHVTDFT